MVRGGKMTSSSSSKPTRNSPHPPRPSPCMRSAMALGPRRLARRLTLHGRRVRIRSLPVGPEMFISWCHAVEVDGSIRKDVGHDDEGLSQRALSVRKWEEVQEMLPPETVADGNAIVRPTTKSSRHPPGGRGYRVTLDAGQQTRFYYLFRRPTPSRYSPLRFHSNTPTSSRSVPPRSPTSSLLGSCSC